MYRLDKHNLLLRHDRNISGMAHGIHKDELEELSLQFYQHLKENKFCSHIKYKNIKLLDLYTRQVKLKLIEVIKTVYRLEKSSKTSKCNFEVISDAQTIDIIRVAIKFLDVDLSTISFKSNNSLTLLVSLNAFLMRSISFFRMIIMPSTLPQDYFYKEVSPDAKTLLITMPRRKTEDFFKSYIKELAEDFNIIIYSMGILDSLPGFERRKVKKEFNLLRGFFRMDCLFFNAPSYVADILFIFKSQSNLPISIDIVRSVFTHKIDLHISRLQTNVVDNFLAIMAKEKGVFVLGDLMEEIFYCDAVICSSESENTKALRLALSDKNKIVIRGNNELMRYRLASFDGSQPNYIKDILDIKNNQQIIFYASDPSKEERQRYLSERFLMEFISSRGNLTLVVKNHAQDSGIITHFAYLDSLSPSNVILIGDYRQRNYAPSKNFNFIENFDFNAAVASSNNFLTTSSTSVFQALILGVKTGIVDLFENNFFRHLVDHSAVELISNQTSFNSFINAPMMEVNNEALIHFGLLQDKEKFNLKSHILECLGDINA
ncbi:MAG: hypothetical protein VW418_00340 [Gammaproteobacteria bacterium]